ncbi:hypothetical protein L5515_014484 [Caenorhabditis briggsae]|uniref:Uncharacterized protein n=1 Tax=Caenorhabditis briggsae TaxID=6238 RepID=A0AAE9EBI8_CAEBR|nr:hypothetical protein L5515_014484 [Caenorhabditis briggsae]
MSTGTSENSERLLVPVNGQMNPQSRNSIYCESAAIIISVLSISAIVAFLLSALILYCVFPTEESSICKNE